MPALMAQPKQATQRHPQIVKAERRAANKRARKARKTNRGN